MASLNLRQQGKWVLIMATLAFVSACSGGDGSGSGGGSVVPPPQIKSPLPENVWEGFATDGRKVLAISQYADGENAYWLFYSDLLGSPGGVIAGKMSYAPGNGAIAMSGVDYKNRTPFFEAAIGGSYHANSKVMTATVSSWSSSFQVIPAANFGQSYPGQYSGSMIYAEGKLGNASSRMSTAKWTIDASNKISMDVSSSCQLQGKIQPYQNSGYQNFSLTVPVTCLSMTAQTLQGVMTKQADGKIYGFVSNKRNDVNSGIVLVGQ